MFAGLFDVVLDFGLFFFLILVLKSSFQAFIFRSFELEFSNQGGNAFYWYVVWCFYFEFSFFLKIIFFVFLLRKGLPIPIDSRFYIFEIKNPRAFMDGRKPIFQEQGPYSFKFVLLPIVVFLV